jgi:hypothetical protein
MGWQSRLPKDKKPEFKKTCNKCGDTGVKRTYVSRGGVPEHGVVPCKCVSVDEPKSYDITIPPLPIK